MQAQLCEVNTFIPEPAEGKAGNTLPAYSKPPLRFGVARPAPVPETILDVDQLAAALSTALDTLTAGPSHEKLALMRHLLEQHRALTEDDAGLAPVDHPNDAQLLACALHYFANRNLPRPTRQAAESGSTEKIDISRVLLQRVQGAPANARVTSLEAANAVLEAWQDSGTGASQDRCDFQIVFEDGFLYQARYHLKKPQKHVSLSRHVRKQLIALATLNDLRQATRTSGEPVLRLMGANLAQAARIALDHYNI